MGHDHNPTGWSINWHGLMAAMFYIVMLGWLIMVPFEPKTDQLSRIADMLFAIWSLMMYLHHHKQWRES